MKKIGLAMTEEMFNDSGNSKSIRVGSNPRSIAIDELLGKIYVANIGSDSVSVIDGYNDSKIKDIPVGKSPVGIAIDTGRLGYYKIYVANAGNDTVSVINGNTDTKEYDIPVGKAPSAIAIDVSRNMIYVANRNSSNISLIDGNTDTKGHDIPVGKSPVGIAVGDSGKIYVANSLSDTVSVINGNTDTKGHDIPVGKSPLDIAVGDSGRIYVANTNNNTVSVINGNADTNEHDIPVGIHPRKIAYDEYTHMIYVTNLGYVTTIPTIHASGGTVSVINGSSNKLAACAIFNVNPANSGKILCNNAAYPTNSYLYVDDGTNCIAQPNKDFRFNTWVESPLTNRNSSIPLDSSGNLTINRYGAFTVNFKSLPPPIPPEYWSLIITVIITTIIGWSIPSIFGWVKARRQLKHLEECISQIGKLDKNEIEDKMKGYYVKGKISEAHRQFLMDKISEYYGDEKASE